MDSLQKQRICCVCRKCCSRGGYVILVALLFEVLSSRSSKCPLRGLPSQCNARLMALPYSDFKGWVKTHPP
eukprot:m.248491 g.248491  ORF g.248491 m.248491 type:complete len:71 (+) comp40290_c0_seq17:3026-3238(+)